MSKNGFINEQKEQSSVKSTIVAKYFNVWANVKISTQKRYPSQAQKIAYIDLLAGPGRYKDRTVSNPLKILTNAVEKTDLRTRLAAFFIDKDGTNSQELENIMAETENINSLTFKPQVWNQEVGVNRSCRI